jgi:hypothetical protein
MLKLGLKHGVFLISILFEALIVSFSSAEE